MSESCCHTTGVLIEAYNYNLLKVLYYWFDDYSSANAFRRENAENFNTILVIFIKDSEAIQKTRFTKEEM